MAKAWEAGRLNGIELEDYTLTAEMIRHTPPEVIPAAFPPAPVARRCLLLCGAKIDGREWSSWIAI